MCEKYDNLVAYARAVIEAWDKLDAEHFAARNAEIARIESLGYRIVNGGQVDGEAWEIHDWRTGELLAQGETLESEDAAMESFNAWTIDAIDMNLPDEWLDGPNVKPPEGVPMFLVDAIYGYGEADSDRDALRYWVSHALCRSSGTRMHGHGKASPVIRGWGWPHGTKRCAAP